MKAKKMEIINGKVSIKEGNVEITDNGIPFTTRIKLNGRPIDETIVITKFVYTAYVDGKNRFKRKMQIEYFDKAK